MAFHNHLLQYAEQRLGDGPAVLGTMDQLGGQPSSSSDAPSAPPPPQPPPPFAILGKAVA